MSFPDGEPIGFYIEENNNTFRISDNADTIFHFRSLGLDVSDRKKWKGIGHIIKSFGMNLENTGEITGIALSSGASSLVSRCIAAMLALADLEREMMNIAPELSDYIDEVEGHLRLWKPNEKLERNVYVTGHSGRLHSFHFKQTNDLIEAARPHSGRTGSILRKAADVHNSSTPPKILVVMDDRDDPERAKIETDILSTLVKVLPFSRLIGNLSGAPEKRH
jgi:hypothetical protein